MRVTILLVWFSFCVVTCSRRETHGQETGKELGRYCPWFLLN